MQIRERPRLEGVAADVEKGFLRPWSIHRTLLLRVLCYENAQSGEEKKKKEFLDILFRKSLLRIDPLAFPRPPSVAPLLHPVAVAYFN